MSGQSAIGWIDIVIILAYLMMTGYLGWLGWRGTRTAADFLIGGRTSHPVIMAISYGATFISTAAIVGFGGVAGLFGMSLLWLPFLNILVGILLAFTLLGEPTRRLGHRLGAHTFPELLGLRYQSRTIQIVAGALIFLTMPLYSAAVMTGGAVFAASQLGVDFEVALLIFALITAAYVIPGGLKAVMYTDTFQGLIMACAMLFLLVQTYASLGGIESAHQTLAGLTDMVPESLRAIGHQGWTSMPDFGWGAHHYDLWWISVSSIILGVGIGVVAQPQLVVRFMTVRSRRELDRAVPIGALFILIMTGTPYLVGSLSNAWFAEHGPLLYGVAQPGQTAELATGAHVQVRLMRQSDTQDGSWNPVTRPDDGTPINAHLVLVDTLSGQDVTGQTLQLVSGRSTALTHTAGDADRLIPEYIAAAMPHWFGMVFFLVLLAAAMSTLSSQFHTIGTAAGRDLYERIGNRRSQTHEPSLPVMRLAIVAGLLLAVSISYGVRQEYVIARFTAIFFGLCAAAFLPAYLGGLFSRRVTRAGALASMAVGMGLSLFWLLFVKAKEAGAIGLVQHLTGGAPSLLADAPNWPVVDSLVIALPAATLTLVVVSAFTRAPDETHLQRCFPPRD